MMYMYLDAMLVIVVLKELHADVVDMVLREETANVLDVSVDVRVVGQYDLGGGLRWRRQSSWL